METFWGFLELIAEFDPFLADHMVKFGQKGKGNPYLSSCTCEELINLMGQKVQNTIAAELQQAKMKGLQMSRENLKPYLREAKSFILKPSVL